MELVALCFFHRHGDRSPFMLMPADVENNARLWTAMGPGMLTPRGMADMEKLGGEFRRRYLTGEPFRLLGPSGAFDRRQYVVRSTDYDRTLQSAESFLAGMFPAGPADGLSTRAQPVPVRTMPAEWDSVLLGFKGARCPRMRELTAAAEHSAAWAQQESAHAELLDALAAASGFPRAVVDLRGTSNVADALVCDRAHGFAWPEPFASRPALFNGADALFKWTLRRMYAASPEMRRLAGGNMLAQVLARFERATGANATTVPERPSRDTPHLEDGAGVPGGVRATQFSAHDTSLVALLGVLDAFDDDNPPYGASVVFELLRDRDAVTRGYMVRAFYNKNDGRNFERPLRVCAVPDAAGLCSLDAFVERHRHVVPTDYEAECAAREHETQVYSMREGGAGAGGGGDVEDSPMWGVVFVLVVILSVVVCATRLGGRLRGRAYQALGRDGDANEAGARVDTV